MLSQDFLTVYLVAFALALDCFAVSVGRGMCVNSRRLKEAMLLPLFFGGFQSAMTLLGWFIGKQLTALISQADHWVAAMLLSAVGLKMIIESRKPIEERENRSLTFLMILTLSIATSIDAFAAGLSLSILKAEVVKASIIIGLVSLTLSLIGFHIGSCAGNILGRRAESLGGFVLIFIGLKILAEHLQII